MATGERGRLYYLMGPSGAGKDTLLQHVGARADSVDAVLVAHRYITRPPAAAGGENHIYVTEAGFAKRLEMGLFSMNWTSHGYHYGIGLEIHTWLARGARVIVNGSRAYLPIALSRYKDLRPIQVSVSPEILAERLYKRRRESETQIRERLARNATLSKQLQPGILTLANDGDPLEAAARLWDMVNS